MVHAQTLSLIQSQFGRRNFDFVRRMANVHSPDEYLIRHYGYAISNYKSEGDRRMFIVDVKRMLNKHRICVLRG